MCTATGEAAEALGCPVVCVHGICNTVTRMCICDDGYTGDDCSGIKDIILQAIEACVENLITLCSW